MITINKGQTNEVSVTLNEKITITNPSFVFVFTNDTTGTTKTFTATDTSLTPVRFNRFSIIENVTEDVYNGTISLTNQGFWSYSIYETPYASPIDLTDLGAELESGKVKVIGNDVVDNIEFDSDYTSDNVIFEP